MKLTEKSLIKIIAILLILTGILKLYGVLTLFTENYNFGIINIEDFEDRFSVLITFQSYHYTFLLSLSSILCGVLLLLKNKWGYKLSVLISFLLGIGMILTSIKSLLSGSISEVFQNQTLGVSDYLILLLLIILPFIFILSSLYLFKKSLFHSIFWTKKEIILFLILAFLAILDRQFISSVAMIVA